MHPHGAQQNEIEREPEPMHDAQVGEAIIEPADAWIGVPALRLSTHAGGGFGGHHVVAEGGEPGGVAARPRTDVQSDQVSTARDELQKRGMHDVGRHALIAYGQGGGLDVVGPDGVAHSIWYPPGRASCSPVLASSVLASTGLILNQDFPLNSPASHGKSLNEMCWKPHRAQFSGAAGIKKQATELVPEICTGR